MSAALWTRETAAQATGGRACGPSWRAGGVSIDSRALAPGDLFVAIRGERHDGHAFVADALERGAAAALVSRCDGGAAGGAPLLAVPDTLGGLCDLARDARIRHGGRRIAVTGSVGKTGTKECLALALSAFGETHRSQGNLNNHIGLPLSLARLDPRARFGVFELGMNHAGEIGPLSRLLRPHLAMITNVAPAHIGFFHSLTQIADAKCEVFEGLVEGGAALLYREDGHFEHCAAAARAAGAGAVYSFGRGEDCDGRLLAATPGPEGTHVRASIAGTALDFSIRAAGEHWALIAVAALTMVHLLGLDVARAAAAIRPVAPGPGRGGQRLLPLAGGGRLRLIDESYNASPPAMRAAFAVFGAARPDAGGRRIAVLGDMRELGASGPGLHRELAEPLLAARPDHVFLAGPLMRHLAAALPDDLVAGHAAVAADLAAALAGFVRAGDVVLVKGSLGTNMAPLMRALLALGQGDGAARTG